MAFFTAEITHSTLAFRRSAAEHRGARRRFDVDASAKHAAGGLFSSRVGPTALPRGDRKVSQSCRRRGCLIFDFREFQQPFVPCRLTYRSRRR
jgi:hypothetical protein